MKRTLLATALVCTAGCYTQQAKLGVLSPSHPGGGLALVGEHAVLAEDCSFSGREQDAFEKALAQAPGADALTQVEVSDHGACALVIARAARFVADAPPPAPSTAASVGFDGSRPEEGKALLYIYRFDVGHIDDPVELALTGVELVSLEDRAMKRVSVAAGVYSGRAERGKSVVKIDALTIEAGRVYYLKVADQSSFHLSATTGLIGAAFHTGDRESFVVQARDPAFGVTEMKYLAAHPDD